MKCPYAVNRNVNQQTIYEYGDNGEMTFQQVIENNTAEFVDCLEENYGAYRDGRCQYNQVD